MSPMPKCKALQMVIALLHTGTGFYNDTPWQSNDNNNIPGSETIYC